MVCQDDITLLLPFHHECLNSRQISELYETKNPGRTGVFDLFFVFFRIRLLGTERFEYLLNFHIAFFHFGF